MYSEFKRLICCVSDKQMVDIVRDIENVIPIPKTHTQIHYGPSARYDLSQIDADQLHHDSYMVQEVKISYNVKDESQQNKSAQIGIRRETLGMSDEFYVKTAQYFKYFQDKPAVWLDVIKSISNNTVQQLYQGDQKSQSTSLQSLITGLNDTGRSLISDVHKEIHQLSSERRRLQKEFSVKTEKLED